MEVQLESQKKILVVTEKKSSSIKINLPEGVQLECLQIDQFFRSDLLKTSKAFILDADLPQLPLFLKQLQHFLKQMQSDEPILQKVFYKSRWDFQSLQSLVNIWHAEHFLSDQDSSNDVKEMLMKIHKDVVRAQKNQELRKEASSQKKQLVKLTDDLEQLVTERTFFIEKSHQEESSKLQKERSLIRFIRDLSEQKNFEDFLSLLKKEHRKVQGLGSPYLFVFHEDQVQVLSYEDDHLHEMNLKSSLSFEDFSEVGSGHGLKNNKKISQTLANWMGRPFGKNMVLGFSDLKVILLFEHNMSEKDVINFQESLYEKFPVLNMAIERLLSIHKMNLFSYRWEKTFDVLQDPVAIIDVDFNVVRSNKKFSTHFYARQCFKTFAGREQPCENCPLIEKGQKSNLIKVDERTYRVSSFPVKSENAQTSTTFIHQYEDVTESRQLYLKMIQGEKMSALGSLAAHLAHELNNPLTGLASMVQILRQDPSLPEQLIGDLGEIEKATLRSQSIIKNLIEFVSEEKGEWKNVSYDEIVEKTWPLLKTSLRTHNLQLHLNTPKSFVYVEPQLLQQVIFNLMNNALQAMKKTGSLTLRSELLGKNEVRLLVQDEGEGIPEDIQSRLFEPFFTTKSEGLGTGLGLSLSKTIVEKFGGRISFTSHAGKGTTFEVVLPLSKKASK